MQSICDNSRRKTHKHTHAQLSRDFTVCADQIERKIWLKRNLCGYGNCCLQIKSLLHFSVVGFFSPLSERCFLISAKLCSDSFSFDSFASFFIYSFIVLFFLFFYWGGGSFICLSVCLSICLPTNLPTYLPIYLQSQY